MIKTAVSFSELKKNQNSLSSENLFLFENSLSSLSVWQPRLYLHIHKVFFNAFFRLKENFLN